MMGDVDKNSKSKFLIIKILSLHIILHFLLLSFSITTATSKLQLICCNYTDYVTKFEQLMKKSIVSSERTRRAESILSKSIQTILHNPKSVKRQRRHGRWDLSEKIYGASLDGTGADSQGFSPPSNIIDGSTNEDDELGRRHLYLLLAQQEAKCLEQYGELEPAATFEFPQDLFQPIVCLPGSKNFTACEQCVQSIKISTSEVSRRDGATGQLNHTKVLATNVFCEEVTQPLTMTTSSSVPTQSLEKFPKESHFVYLKSLLNDGGNRPLAEKQVPVVFVIEQSEFVPNGGSWPSLDSRGKWTHWRALGKSPYAFDKVQVAYRQRTYQWRVTAVCANGLLAVSIVKPFKTLDGYMKSGPPRSVFVIDHKSKESTVDVLVGWDPPQERACFYKIVLETGSGVKTGRTIRIKGVPLGVHKLWFRELIFGTTYEVRITSRSADWDHDESTDVGLSFSTPTCLNAHQFSFDKCAPPPPRNLSYSMKTGAPSKTTENPRCKRYFTVNLVWESPAHTSATNLIKNYMVDMRAFSWNHHIKNLNCNTRSRTDELIDLHEIFDPLQIQLPGNVTQLMVDNLDEAAMYKVLVFAVSSKGSSLAATLTIKFDSVKLLDSAVTVGIWFHLCCYLATLLLFASGCFAGKRIYHRRQVRTARDSHFRSIERRVAVNEDWSVLYLAEDPQSTWKAPEENSFAKESSYVGFQDLTVGDIIGRGAFGIVRKANISNERYLELLKRLNSNTTVGTDYQVCSTESDDDDETAMRTVALKMLRGFTTTADREDIIKELKIMQNIGVHPQIVTLLGVCISPKSVGLVLEYCPGGDLLSFLRKVRELALSTTRSKRGIWCENPEYKSYSYGDQLMNRNPSRSGDQCRPDFIQINELPSSSQELVNVTPGVTREVTEIEISACIHDEPTEYEYISDKDLVCYAHQIALGMAYLERHHIIHRDLACRNLLVTRDHKRVKISDFGLSRDIYTGTVYEQTTKGKLPFKWMALESITSRIFTSKSDVWSYGIVLWELVTMGNVPYPALENEQLLKMLSSGYRMERPENCSEEMYALMRKCWRSVPEDRPNFTQLISYLEAMKTGPEV